MYVNGDVQLTGSNLQEYPFGTVEGQSPVAISESETTRQLRMGRRAFSIVQDKALTASVINSLQHTARLDTIFYPKLITFSADVDGLMRMYVTPGLNYDTYNTGLPNAEYFYNATYKAASGALLLRKHDLEHIYYWFPTGKIDMQFTPISVGIAQACFSGVEVSING